MRRFFLYFHLFIYMSVTGKLTAFLNPTATCHHERNFYPAQ